MEAENKGNKEDNGASHSWARVARNGLSPVNSGIRNLCAISREKQGGLKGSPGPDGIAVLRGTGDTRNPVGEGHGLCKDPKTGNTQLPHGPWQKARRI